jgi:GntR family transcriptional repressor for pyruvate dehydrogenase complex
LKFKRLTSANPSQEIVSQVRQKIASGELAKGDRLPTERLFAEQLGISRNTIRKAITSLKQLGLVSIKKGPSGGAFISQEGGEAIRSVILDLFHLGSISSGNLTEARIVLLPAVVRLACQRRKPEDIQRLEENVRMAEEALAAGDVANRMRLNIEFYRLLGNAARNPVLTVVTEAVSEVILQFVRAKGLLPSEAVMPIRYRLIKCLKSQDVDTAVAAMASHLIRLEELYRERPSVRKSGTRRKN